MASASAVDSSASRSVRQTVDQTTTSPPRIRSIACREHRRRRTPSSGPRRPRRRRAARRTVSPSAGPGIRRGGPAPSPPLERDLAEHAVLLRDPPRDRPAQRGRRVERDLRRAAGSARRAASRTAPVKPRNAATARLGGRSSTVRGVPGAASRPSSSTISRSASAHASARSCRTTNVARSGSRSTDGGVAQQRGAGRRVDARRTARRAAATSARSAIARARCTRRASPPESAPAGRSASSPTLQALQRLDARAPAARPSARPTTPSAASTFARTERRASAGACSAAATRPSASTRPATGSQQPGERRQQRRLARAVGPEHGDELAAAQLEVDAGRDRAPAAPDRERRTRSGPDRQPSRALSVLDRRQRGGDDRKRPSITVP